MGLSHFSSLSWTLQNQCCTFVSFPKIEPSDLRWKTHQTPVHVFFPKTEAPDFRSKARQRPPRRNLQFACSAEKSSKRRASRSTKSNEELCNELGEFIVTMGLPEAHVPSYKELLEHGRKDLANIVRRRGYKVVTELLRNSSEKCTNIEKHTPGNQDISNACKDEASEDQERNLNEYAECVTLPRDSSLVESCMVRENDSTATDTIQICEPSESSIGSLHLKAANFIHTGVLDPVEDALEVENVKMSTDVELTSDILNSDGADTASLASQQVSPCFMEQHSDRDYAALGELDDAVTDLGLASEMACERDNLIEIDRLKAMLHQKEMELSLLKQQIETEKEALSNLQAKANAQIGSAHGAISAQDMELLAAEESLSGLKEVQIEYRANGETVEVSGSFNGWHQQIRMDPHPRKSQLWSTCLWLYPGIYEIKFIVDGHWVIDPHREIATSGHITNNVLRVDR